MVIPSAPTLEEIEESELLRTTSTVRLPSYSSEANYVSDDDDEDDNNNNDEEQNEDDDEITDLESIIREHDLVDKCMIDSSEAEYHDSSTSSTEISESNGNDGDDDDVVLCSLCVFRKSELSCSSNENCGESEEGEKHRQQRHEFCAICLSRYSLNAFERNGDYENNVLPFAAAAAATSSESENDEGDIENAVGTTAIRRRSERGQLPCPFFKTNECDCTAFSEAVLQKNLNKKAVQRWRQADNRIIEAIGDAAEEVQNDSEVNDIEQPAEVAVSSPLDIVRGAVEEALTRSRRTLCPSCKLPGEKDAACMHITCPDCQTRWCYCCGRRRGDAIDQCNTCDTTSPYLENAPGWSGFAKIRERPGEGALHEFHRRRAKYYLRSIHAALPVELWTQLRSDDSTNTLLRHDAAGPGRSITWREIEQNAQIPVFGSTRPDQVRWVEEGYQLVNAMLESLTDGRKSTRTNDHDDSWNNEHHPHALALALQEGESAAAPAAAIDLDDDCNGERPSRAIAPALRRGESVAEDANREIDYGALVPLHIELKRRYQERRGGRRGWIWTIGIIALGCAFSILPQDDRFRFWAGIVTCVVSTFLSSYLFIGLVEINHERIGRTGALGGKPFAEVLFLGSEQTHPYLCTRGELRNWQWPHAMTLWGSLVFAALFSGPSARVKYPGVGVGLWTFHFMVGIVSPLLLNTVFRPILPVARSYIKRVVMVTMWGWIIFPMGMFMLYRARPQSIDNDVSSLEDPSRVIARTGFWFIVGGVLGVLTETYLCWWTMTNRHDTLARLRIRIILSYAFSLALVTMAYWVRIGRTTGGIFMAFFISISCCAFCVTRLCAQERR